MKLTGENRSTGGKTCPSATLSTTNPTWTDPESNPGLRGGRPATNRLSHDTAWRLSCSISLFWQLSYCVFASALFPVFKKRERSDWLIAEDEGNQSTNDAASYRCDNLKTRNSVVVYCCFKYAGVCSVLQLSFLFTHISPVVFSGGLSGY
jgi:hypothetical protein